MTQKPEVNNFGAYGASSSSDRRIPLQIPAHDSIDGLPRHSAMRTVKLYGNGSATANAVASVTIPSKSRIRGVQVAVMFDSITDNSAVQLEVSLASAREIATNGAQQCVCEVVGYSNFVTSGLAQNGANQFFPVSVDVVQGQLVYLHAVVTGTATYTAAFILHYE